jgi:hypothetical protein
MSHNLNLDKILEDYASEVGGKIIQYTENQSIIIMPTKHGRFQRVIGWTRTSNKHKFLEFDSKVCEFSDTIDLQNCLKEAAKFTFSRLIIKEGFLQIASSVIVEHANTAIIRDMIKEVAEVADELEFVLTGADVH